MTSGANTWGSEHLFPSLSPAVSRRHAGEDKASTTALQFFSSNLDDPRETAEGWRAGTNVDVHRSLGFSDAGSPTNAGVRTALGPGHRQARPHHRQHLIPKDAASVAACLDDRFVLLKMSQNK